MKLKGGEYKYMEEKNILLLSKEVEEKAEIKEEFAKEVGTPTTKEKDVIKKNAFSSYTYNQERTSHTSQETVKNENFSSIIEKPNYDYIEELTPEEEQKVYKIEKEKQTAKPKYARKRLRIALFSLVLSVCSIWGIINIISISNLQSQISAVTETYQLNLFNYLSKLATLDTASNYNELFPTYPEAQNPPASVEKSSNWFDRFCDFIAGLFGG